MATVVKRKPSVTTTTLALTPAPCPHRPPCNTYRLSPRQVCLPLQQGLGTQPVTLRAVTVASVESVEYRIMLITQVELIWKTQLETTVLNK